MPVTLPFQTQSKELSVKTVEAVDIKPDGKCRCGQRLQDILNKILKQGMEVCIVRVASK